MGRHWDHIPFASSSSIFRKLAVGYGRSLEAARGFPSSSKLPPHLQMKPNSWPSRLSSNIRYRSRREEAKQFWAIQAVQVVCHNISLGNISCAGEFVRPRTSHLRLFADVPFPYVTGVALLRGHSIRGGGRQASMGKLERP